MPLLVSSQPRRTRSHRSHPQRKARAQPYDPSPAVHTYDPHSLEKYNSVGYIRADIITTWTLDNPAASVGLYYPISRSSRNTPLHPEINEVQQIFHNFVNRAISRETRDDREIFVAGHSRQFICYGITVIDEQRTREYWAEFRGLNYDHQGVFHADILAHQITLIVNSGANRIGQVRGITEILRSELGHPVTYGAAA